MSVLVALLFSVKFAFLTDIHISEGSSRADDLSFCIERINADTTLNFTVFGGDITNFGSDREIKFAKKVMDRLERPYHIVAGNHDAKWSESGCNTFLKVFGYEHFDFEAGGVRFLGCNCGPNMRMAPAMLPRESLLWLDSTACSIPARQPVIFVNHYPVDSTTLNWFKATNALKQCNIALCIGGHFHKRHIKEYDGIPGILCCVLENKGVVGYNVVNIEGDSLSVREYLFSKREGEYVPVSDTLWYSMRIPSSSRFSPDSCCADRHFLPEDYPWTGYEVNSMYPGVQCVWEYVNDSDIGAGAVPCCVSRRAARHSAPDGCDAVAVADESGRVRLLSMRDGKLLWTYPTGGKVFSTPATDSGMLVVGSSDGYVYCLKLSSGRLLWKYRCNGPVLASPVILDGTVYCGCSDGVFRALRLSDGQLEWEYGDVAGFVECRPYVDESQVVFGSWGNALYSLDTKTGALMWKWTCSGSRMFSPAAVNPVKSNGCIFFVTPRRKTYCLDASSGKQLWEADGGRESIALSPEGDCIYVKNMFHKLHCFDAAPVLRQRWCVEDALGYDIAPTSCSVAHGCVYVPTDKGLVGCMDASDGSLLWQHKLSYGLINSIAPLGDGRLLVCTMDGVVTLIKAVP